MAFKVLPWIFSGPDLHSKLPSHISDAVTKEVAAYGLPKEKAEMIAAKVSGAAAAHHEQNSAFTASFAGMGASDREATIRNFIREYVQAEIDIETSNASSDILSQLTEGKDVLGTIDPRGKDYESYRKGVTGLFFSEEATKDRAEIEKSSYNEALEPSIKELNDGTRTLAQVTAQQAAMETEINYHLKEAVFNPATGRFESYEDIMIGRRIDQQKAEGKIKFRNAAERDEIIRKVKAVRSGAVTPAASGLDAHYTAKGNKDFTKLTNSLKEDFSTIKLNPNTGKYELKGDSLDGIFKGGLKSAQSTTQIKTQADKGLRETQLNHFAANIADLSTITSSSTASAADRARASDLIEKNKLATDILNVSEAARHAGKLTGTSATQYSNMKSRIETQVLAGAITFKSIEERDAFLNALRTDDFKRIQAQLKPGLMGTSSINQFFNTVNKELLDFSGSTNTKAAAARVLNYANSMNFYKKESLDQLMWACQIATDPGYAFEEGKKALLKKYGIELPKKFDVKEALWSQTFKLLGRFGGDKEGLEKIKNFYSDPGKMMKEEGTKALTKFLKKGEFEFWGKKYKVWGGGIDISNLKNGLWNAFLKSDFYRLGRQKLNQNLAYLSQKSLLGLSRMGGRMGSALNRLASRSMGSISMYLARSFSGLSNFFGGALFSNLPGSGMDFVDSIKAIVIGIGCTCGGLILLGNILLFGTLLGLFSRGDSYAGGQDSPQAQLVDVNLIASSGNQSISSYMNAYPSFSGWNNLNYSDFNGTDTDRNCNIMLEVRKQMGTLFPGNGKLLNLNSQYINNFEYVGSNFGDSSIKQYWCTYLALNSYKSIDPGINAAAGTAKVVGMDKYLSESEKYNLYPLARAQNTGTSLNVSQSCVKKSNFKPGNIVIMRHGTCNDQPPGGSYQKPTAGNSTESTTAGHVALVLKLEGDTLYTISSNDSVKKRAVPVSSEGCSPDEVKIKGPLKLKSGGGYEDLYYCKMFEYTGDVAACICKGGTGGSLDPRCEMPANNYPDVPNAITSN